MAAKTQTGKNQGDEKKPWIFTQPFAKIYPLYVDKAEKKGRTQDEVNKIIRWLTGYKQNQLAAHLRKDTDVETFFSSAPLPNPNRKLITGVVCGVLVEEIDDPIVQEYRYLDKMIEELVRGKTMAKILREPSPA